jgi:hypothetical protein
VDLFTRRGFDVVQRLSALPDEDFVYLANARYFLPTGGGYGGQASTCVERLGGSTIRVPGGAGAIVEPPNVESKNETTAGAVVEPLTVESKNESTRTVA